MLDPISGRVRRAADDARLAAVLATLTWYPVRRHKPEPDQWVLVKLHTGKIEPALWPGKRRHWVLSPFSAGGRPVAWSESLLPIDGTKGIDDPDEPEDGNLPEAR
jgi:hypothetical protein